MLIIRTFLGGKLDHISTWGQGGSLHKQATSKPTTQTQIQINIVIQETEKHVRHATTLANGAHCFFATCSADKSSAVTQEILLENKIIGIVELLTPRELEVLEAITDSKNTKNGADKLHISERTFANHRFNIRKKTGYQAADVAQFIFDYSNVELFISMLK